MTSPCIKVAFVVAPIYLLTVFYVFCSSGILKQIWDLSDQDNDSMLSLHEFCTALYFMERHREGRMLPSVAPPGIHLPTLEGSIGQGPEGHGVQNTSVWRHIPGLKIS
jgi:epidermal growth factor receptor substrate 15